jgi:hypothetical protein
MCPRPGCEGGDTLGPLPIIDAPDLSQKGGENSGRGTPPSLDQPSRRSLSGKNNPSMRSVSGEKHSGARATRGSSTLTITPSEQGPASLQRIADEPHVPTDSVALVGIRQSRGRRRDGLHQRLHSGLVAARGCFDFTEHRTTFRRASGCIVSMSMMSAQSSPRSSP